MRYQLIYNGEVLQEADDIKPLLKKFLTCYDEEIYTSLSIIDTYNKSKKVADYYWGEFSNGWQLYLWISKRQLPIWREIFPIDKFIKS